MNMSYCRFENTMHDFMDCKRALEDLAQGSNSEDKLSSSELSAARGLVEAAYELAQWVYEQEKRKKGFDDIESSELADTVSMLNDSFNEEEEEA